MKYIKNFNVREFGFWGSARQVYMDFAMDDKTYVLQEMIEEHFDGMTPTETEINDYVAHELETEEE